MGEVVKLRRGSDPEFVGALRETAEHLDAAAQQLQEDLVAAAMTGPWRAWSDQQEVGTLLHVTGEMMLQTGNPAITRLCGTLAEMRRAVDELACYRSGGGDHESPVL